MAKNNLLLWCGVLGASAVTLGALGAHALKGKVQQGLMTPEQLSGFETGARYHLFHTLALLGVILLRHHSSHRAIAWAGNLFIVGIILFSGSLYFLTTRDLLGMPGLTWLGPVTPIGGLLLIAGWLSLCIPAFNKS